MLKAVGTEGRDFNRDPVFASQFLFSLALEAVRSRYSYVMPSSRILAL
jgi:hypothetical protein